jgi:hypothetical protein
MHDRIGVEIIKSAFQSEQLVSIVSQYQNRFDGEGHGRKNLVCGKNIPLGARILTIVDAYDSMCAEKIYRQPMTSSEAVAELRANAVTQFDPDLVEEFVDILANQVKTSPQPTRVSRQAALRIGMQMESIAEAVDNKDDELLIGLAENLASVAQRAEARDVKELADELCRLAQEEGDYEDLVKTTDELLNVCRLANAAYINVM